MFRDFVTILKDMTAGSVHTPTAIGGGKAKSFKAVIAEAKKSVGDLTNSHDRSIGRDTRSPQVGDIVEVDSDLGAASNAPWKSKVTEVDPDKPFRIKVAYDDGADWYHFSAADVDDYDDVDGAAHWFFRKRLAKRSLQSNADSATAKSPFLYDPNALGSLRPDQVPRFFGAITDSDKLPTKEVKLDELHAMQDRVDPAKVSAIAEHGAGGKPAVVVQHNGKHYIADGHHRLAADWLAGKDTATVAFKDLEPVDHALKSAPKVDLDFQRIGKIDEGEGIVYGWAIVSKVDGQPYYDLNIDHAGEHAGKRVPENVPEATLAKCALGFVDGGAPGNEMHEGPNVGDFPFVMPMTTELFKGLFGDSEPPKTGLIVGYRPPADVLAKFRSGHFTGFSIEGSRLEYTEHQA